MDSPRLDARYELVRPLGSGSMGEVHAATDRTLNRLVAIKLLREEFESGSSAAFVRFRREIQILAKLSHANIVRLFDAGTLLGRPCFVMSLHPGTDLQTRLCDGPIELQEGVRILLQILQALVYLHDNGILHRDLKPSNVLLEPEGRVLLVDFGIARQRRDGPLTDTGVILGTPLFMSPELFRDGAHSRASDLWSVGVIAYTMLSGIHPFAGSSYSEELANITGRSPQPLVNLRADISRELADWVSALMEKEPKDRPGRAAEALARLASTPEARPVTGGHIRQDTGQSDRQTRSRARRTLVRGWVGPAVLGLALVASAVGIWQQGSGARIAPVASATPKASAVIVRTTPRTLNWKAIEKFAAALKADPLPHAVEAELKSATGLNLGASSRTWYYLWQFGQWLDGPAGGGPPEPAHRNPGCLDQIEEGLFSRRLRDIYPDGGQPLWTSALRYVEAWPEDGRSWLLLGRALSLDGGGPHLLPLYRHALSRLNQTGARMFSRYLIEALTEAMDVTGQTNPAIWLRYLNGDADDGFAWQTLFHQFPLSERREVLERFLGAARQIPAFAEQACLYSGHLHNFSQEPGLGLEVWRIGLREHPAWSHIANALIHASLDRGDLMGVSHLLGRCSAAEAKAWTKFVGILQAAVPTRYSDPLPIGLTEYWRARMLAFLKLEATGDLTDEDMQSAESEDLTEWRAITRAERLAAGHGTAVDEDVLRRHTLARRSSVVQEELTGIMNTDRGRPWMEELLRLRTGNAAEERSLRALWSSRCGLDARALALLRSYSKSDLLLVKPGVVAEIVCRALLKKIPVNREEAPMDDLIAGIGDGPQARCLELLAAGQVGPCGNAAAELVDQFPGDHVWALLAVAMACQEHAMARAAQWVNRVEIRSRFVGFGLWRIREVRRLIGQPGAKLYQPGPIR